MRVIVFIFVLIIQFILIICSSFSLKNESKLVQALLVAMIAVGCAGVMDMTIKSIYKNKNTYRGD